MSTPRSRLRPGVTARRALGYVVVAGLAFGAGALVVKPAGAAHRPGVLDEAAARISQDAAQPGRPGDPAEGRGRGDAQRARRPVVDLLRPGGLLRLQRLARGPLHRRRRVAAAAPRRRRLVASVQEVDPGCRGRRRAPGTGSSAVDGTSTHGRGAWREVARQLRGEPGQPCVTLRWRRRVEPTRDVSVTRVRGARSDDVTVERLSGGVLRHQGRPRSPAASAGRCAQRSPRTPSSGDDRSGVVLDLRSNPGGLVDEAVEVAGAFLDGGVGRQLRPPRPGHPHARRASPGGDARTPLVVLVDGGTASAAEIVTARPAGPRPGRRRRVAGRSARAPCRSRPRCSDGSAIELTVGQYVTPAGTHASTASASSPTSRVDATPDPAAAERRALEVLTGLVASLPTARGGAER